MVVRPDVDITELRDGCLCCSLNEQLPDVLEELCYRQRRSTNSTGIADPSGVVVPFLMLPIVQREFPLKQVICLVDAELIEDQLRDTEEAIQQISGPPVQFSNVILINKTDRVCPDNISTLIKTLRGLKPFA